MDFEQFKIEYHTSKLSKKEADLFETEAVHLFENEMTIACISKDQYGKQYVHKLKVTSRYKSLEDKVFDILLMKCNMRLKKARKFAKILFQISN